jgi:DNA-binding transcriptional MerR regulator
LTLPFAGHVVVFTGKLSSLSRREAGAIVQDLGGAVADDVTSRTTMVVVGAEGFTSRVSDEDQAEKSQKLRKADEINRRQAASIRIIGEDEFCRIANRPSPESLKQQFYGTREVRALYSSVGEDHLRYLEKWGLIRPAIRTHAERYYGFADLLVIRQTAAELEHGASFRSVLRSLTAARAGQLAFDFRSSGGEAHTAKVVTLERRAAAQPVPQAHVPGISQDEHRALQYFLEGARLDEGHEANQEGAIAAYRRALLLDPELVPALVNLANLLYARDQLIEAQALYERALGLDADCFEAHFNLGNVHHDLGRYAEAKSCYDHAVRLNPVYADAQFYLAVTLEKLGRSQDARPHWREYQRLAPAGQWVELAKEFTEE